MRNKKQIRQTIFLDFRSTHDPVLNRQVNVFRKVYFRSERIADKTSMEYVHAKQLSALLAEQILQELKLEKQRVTPN